MQTEPQSSVYTLKLFPYKTFFALLVSAFFFASCSFHYDQGKSLESEKRWEEAAIEYHFARVENPGDSDIQAALKRVNLKVAQENMERYQDYLDNKEYRKAYRRLEAATLQDPNFKDAQEEMKLWDRVLIAGKVSFKFNRLQSNLRLAREMRLQVQVNTPSGLLLSGTISEDGIFFVEDWVYHYAPERLAQYTLNSIGLELRQGGVQSFARQEFQAFIQFRELSPSNIEGKLNTDEAAPQGIAEHRDAILSADAKQLLQPWLPPRLLHYTMHFDQDIIQLHTPSRHAEFAPQMLYLNHPQQRGFVDFGSYQLEQNEVNRKWTIQRLPYTTAQTDYFETLSQNLALNPYFYYSNGAYRYVLGE